MKPRLLDLFCGQGGAGMGYARAGFDVTGVDIVPQPRNPHPVIVADALQYVREHGREYDAIHASPPCQFYTTLADRWRREGREYPDLIGATRAALQETGRPWVVENVMAAPLANPITLCGEMFGLLVIRHRLFESNMLLLSPPHMPHRGPARGAGRGTRYTQEGHYYSVYGHGGGKGSTEAWREAMGMPWADKYGLTQGVPPAYT